VAVPVPPLVLSNVAPCIGGVAVVAPPDGGLPPPPPLQAATEASSDNTKSELFLIGFSIPASAWKLHARL
jgi:hypothetical protein